MPSATAHPPCSMVKQLAAAALGVVSVVAISAPRPAEACSFAPDGVHELDPAHGSDTIAPSAPEVTPTVRRWEYPSSCFDIAMVELAVSATDNATPGERMGYQLRVVGGDPPEGLRAIGEPLTANDIVPAERGLLSLFFDYRDETFAFELEVRAKDLNGNVGPPTVMFIADEPQQDVADTDGGCSVHEGTSRAHAVVALLTLISLLIALRPRR